MQLNEILAKSESRISKLNSIVAHKTRQLITAAFNEGIYIVIVQGLRIMDEQAALYAQGRTTAGSIVTNAKAGYSCHNYGVAIDFALLADDGVNVLWTVNDKWRRVGAIGKSLGFVWGGDWTVQKEGIVDFPHFEMCFGLSINELLKGAKLPELEEDDDMNKILEYEQWAWDELNEYLGCAYNDGTIEDWKWVQAVRDKTLTYKDLLLLKVLIDERRRKRL
ncbi:M15 family metallopeptidase [Paenibacillus frigoriresistens]|uniref:M15 family metallopeptidase n=1 Tax=Paenibacillus alginolyticus TaxID=59839 RepID=UPI0015660628|nr:M15 family metallopeptidase [Paenibacillus frigoriresistens]NRF94821.1 M15 family metallopeptidase [Paenibacillus frigoriresistens]